MKKILSIAIFVAALLTLTTGTAFAQEATPITGTVQNVEILTDATTGEEYVAVTVLDGTTGTTQVVNISVEDAETLGLVTTDTTTGTTTVADGAIDSEVTIPAEDILPGEGEEEEEAEKEHPVGSALGEYFGEVLGVDYDTIMTAREEYGVGFGVIAQALWLTNQIDGGTIEFEALLEAKMTGNYENIKLADGSTPDNWGDVVKSLKKGENLGSVMSGKADAEGTDDATDEDENGKGKDKDKGNDGENGKGKGKDKDKDKGNKGKGNGNKP